MLYLIGTGLYYLKDMPIRAIELLKTCEEVYLERYTNLNDISSLKELENKIGKNIAIASREVVESEFITRRAQNKIVALLVPGDPLSATTHISILKDCKEMHISYEVVHASSIFTAISESGLSLYKFGATCSLPIFTENFKPESFFDVIENNLKMGLHTLLLMEVKNENDFVDVKTALDIIKKIEIRRGLKLIDWNTVIAVSRLGSDNQKIVFATSAGNDLKPPLAMFIPGKLSAVEADTIKILVSKS
ncbi:diphthine synthase [Candidatus Parvarchaeota archaeon]|jgi:diphthine synthase|nr:diphthine synthase [Candidatus Parvarchaeota archaeon]